MAGGIDWFRWHHGTVNDQKFPLVAKRAGASVAEVVAVWACLLEAASMSADRGELVAEPDFDALDCALGMSEGRTQAIFNSLCDRGLIDESLQITAWPRRQPKREREDDTAAERKRTQREREAAASGVSDGVTPSHATSHQKTPRGEESREEEVSKPSASHPPAKADGPSRSTIPCPYAAIVSAYHEALPGLPRVKLMPPKRQAALRKAWGWVLSSRKSSDGKPRATDADQALAWFRGYFEHAAKSDFLMGRSARKPEHAGWRCDLDFLLTDNGMKHVIEKTEEAAA